MLAAALHVRANPASDALRARASMEIYSLDDEQGLATWRQRPTLADPQDAAAWRGLAGGIIAHIAMTRGTMTVDSYLGRVAAKDESLAPPPAELAREFQAAVDRAIALGRQHVAAVPRSQAHYELGSAVGIRALVHWPTIDGGIIAAFRAAREAFDEHEKVLSLNPARADAGLIVGTYRYPGFGAVDADAVGRVHGGLRRRARTRSSDGRRCGGLWRRQPG